MTRRGGIGRRGLRGTARDRPPILVDEEETNANRARPNMPPRQVTLLDLLILMVGALWISEAFVGIHELHIQDVYFRLAFYLLGLVVGGVLGVSTILAIYRISYYFYARVIEPGELIRSERSTHTMMLVFLIAQLLLWMIVALVLSGRIMKLIYHAVAP
jgi:uncharacterized membrane-anchored protein